MDNEEAYLRGFKKKLKGDFNLNLQENKLICGSTLDSMSSYVLVLLRNELVKKLFSSASRQPRCDN